MSSTSSPPLLTEAGSIEGTMESNAGGLETAGNSIAADALRRLIAAGGSLSCAESPLGTSSRFDSPNASLGSDFDLSIGLEAPMPCEEVRLLKSVTASKLGLNRDKLAFVGDKNDARVGVLRFSSSPVRSGDVLRLFDKRSDIFGSATRD